MKQAGINGLFILFMILVGSCRVSNNNQIKQGTIEDYGNGNSYAVNFRLSGPYGDSTIMEVFHPWQHSTGISYRYLLQNKQGALPALVPGTNETPVSIPVNRVIITSTTHIPYISALGRINSIVGISGEKYIYDSVLCERIANHQVKDVGYDQNLNYELIISLHPDVVFAYGVTGEVSNHISRLANLGIPVVLISEYLEEHPLGKAEWIKVFAAFFGQSELGDSLFRATAAAYESLAELALGIRQQPGVLSGLPWNDTWYVPGGRSFAARLIHDAGGNYLWKDNESSEAVPLDMEAVYQKARKAEYWINPGAANTRMEILSLDSRLGEIEAFKSDRVFNNNARINDYGGNDYWESGVMHPDKILRDLIGIFHPGMLPSPVLVYYKKI